MNLKAHIIGTIIGVALTGSNALLAATGFTVERVLTLQPGTVQQRTTLGQIAAAKELVAQEFAVASADFNDDGQSETILQAQSSAFCGASGCVTLVIADVNGQQTVVLRQRLFAGLALTKEMVNGYRALAAVHEKSGAILGVGNAQQVYAMNVPVTASPARASGNAGATPPASRPRPTNVATAPPTPKICAGAKNCDESSELAVTIADVRTSTTGNSRYVTLNVSFRNKTARPLVLGYQRGSALLVDDQGNRYAISGSVRGIPEIVNGNEVDTSFVLQPGESGDGRFEFQWRGSAIAGTIYDVDLSVRELNLYTGNQVRLGKELAMSFKGLQPGAAASTASAPTSPAPTNSPAARPTAPQTDPCNGAPNCYAAGPFVAEVSRLTTSQPSKGPVNASIVQRIDVRFRNVSDKPVILAHDLQATVVDSNGNRYKYWAGNKSANNVTGMGVIWNNQIDASFVLRPGESRVAAFEQNFLYNASRTMLGTSYTFDLSITEVEVTPSQQVRILRQHALGFRDLTARTSASANTASGTLDEAVDTVDQAKKTLDGIKGLFKKN